MCEVLSIPNLPARANASSTYSRSVVCCTWYKKLCNGKKRNGHWPPKTHHARRAIAAAAVAGSLEYSLPKLTHVFSVDVAHDTSTSRLSNRRRSRVRIKAGRRPWVNQIMVVLLGRVHTAISKKTKKAKRQVGTQQINKHKQHAGISSIARSKVNASVSPSSREDTQSSYRVLCSQALGKVKSKVNELRPLSPPSPTRSCLD